MRELFGIFGGVKIVHDAVQHRAVLFVFYAVGVQLQRPCAGNQKIDGHVRSQGTKQPVLLHILRHGDPVLSEQGERMDRKVLAGIKTFIQHFVDKHGRIVFSRKTSRKTSIDVAQKIAVGMTIFVR